VLHHGGKAGGNAKYVLRGLISERTLRAFVENWRAGKVPKYVRSQPVPKKQSKAVKVVVGKSVAEVALDPTKDVIVEFFAPWCGECKKFGPILEKWAASMATEDPNLVVAAMDHTQNDFDLEGVSGTWSEIHSIANMSESSVSATTQWIYTHISLNSENCDVVSRMLFSMVYDCLSSAHRETPAPVTAYPTVYLFPAGDAALKRAPRVFEGDRTAKGLAAFLRDVRQERDAPKVLPGGQNMRVNHERPKCKLNHSKQSFCFCATKSKRVRVDSDPFSVNLMCLHPFDERPLPLRIPNRVRRPSCPNTSR
jgi:thiol-disulfide isomerase/thioredoxin